MDIRRAKIKDLEEVVVLSCKSAIYHEELASYYDIDKNAKHILSVSLKKNIYSLNSSIFVAEENGNIIGYLLACKVNRLDMFKIKKAGLIADVFVEEKDRRKGVGGELVKECLKWFKKNDIYFIEISVEALNKKAINFWNKKGFKDVFIGKYKKI